MPSPSFRWKPGLNLCPPCWLGLLLHVHWAYAVPCPDFDLVLQSAVDSMLVHKHARFKAVADAESSVKGTQYPAQRPSPPHEGIYCSRSWMEASSWRHLKAIMSRPCVSWVGLECIIGNINCPRPIPKSFEYMMHLQLHRVACAENIWLTMHSTMFFAVLNGPGSINFMCLSTATHHSSTSQSVFDCLHFGDIRAQFPGLFQDAAGCMRMFM